MKKLIFVFLLSSILYSFSFLYGAHMVRQVVDDWPTTHDTTGVSWVVYSVDSVQYNSFDDPVNTYIVYPFVGSSQIAWYTDVDNWGWVWAEGDEMVSFGSWDSAYAANPGTYPTNPNHTGFYWIFNDTLDEDASPQTWATSPTGMWDTLRPMPLPVASLNKNGDSVIIQIPNPVETTGNPATINVMGFWVFADTTSPAPPGYPSTLTKEVGYFPRAPGATTQCKDPVSNYPAGRNVIFAYRIVARPETSAVDTPPGYTSQYFSGNSNALLIPTGIEETGLTASATSYGIRLRWYVMGYLSYQYAEIVRDGKKIAETNRCEYLDKDVLPNHQYTYNVSLIFSNGERRLLGPIRVTFQGREGLGLDFTPNPFKGEGKVLLTVPYTQHITLKVYDVSGREIETLYSGNTGPGLYRFKCALSTSGIYHIVVFDEHRKIMSKKVLSF